VGREKTRWKKDPADCSFFPGKKIREEGQRKKDGQGEGFERKGQSSSLPDQTTEKRKKDFAMGKSGEDEFGGSEFPRELKKKERGGGGE